MIKRAFVDTDILLDVALAREPFVEASKLTLVLLENYIALGFITSNEVTNLYYILRKIGGDNNARKFITGIVNYLTVIPVEHSDVLDALRSKMPDFEDSVQYHSALRNQCDLIITRNINDYKTSKVEIMTPVNFLSNYKELL